MRLPLALALSAAACTAERAVAPPDASATPPTPVAEPAAPEHEAPVPAAQPASSPAPVPAARPASSHAPADLPRAASLELTADELLVLRVPTESKWRALRRAPGAPDYIECELVAAEPLGHLELIRGEIRVTARPIVERIKHACELVRIDARFSRTEHPIRPLTRDHLGELVLGLPPAEQASWLTSPDVEKAPIRGFVGGKTGLVVFASAWLRDLGTHFAVPNRPLMTRAELESDLDARRAAGKRVALVNGAHHFAPQVTDAAERIAIARLPVLSVTAATSDYQDEGPTAVPLYAAGERRHLLFQQHMVKYSWEAALRRGRMIERIVEDGATARPPAAK